MFEVIQSSLRYLLIHASLVNAFGYWQGMDITNATATYLDDLQQAIGHIQDLAGLNTVEIMNGETGWPGDGIYLIHLADVCAIFTITYILQVVTIMTQRKGP